MMEQRIGEIGFALQSGVGVPASNPSYAVGVQEGFPEPVQDFTAWAPAAHRLVMQEVRKGLSRWETGTTMWAHPASLGTLLKAILPTENVSGGYDHAFTPSATDQYLTLFSTRGGMYEKFADGLIESFVLDWMSGRRVYVTVQASGLAPSLLGSAYTPGVREDDHPNAEVFHYIGATMKLDWADTPATTTLTNIEDGALRLTRDLTFVPTADDTDAMAMIRGPLRFETQLSLVWTDDEGYRTTFFGAATGTAPSPIVVEGSLSFTFVSPINPSTRTLKIEVPRATFRVSAPQPRPRGGALMSDVQAIGLRPSSGSFVTVTLKNGVSAPY